MASSGKKGKKNKGTVISLQSFLANGDTPAGVTQVAKKIRNVDGDDSDDGSNSIPMIVQLPTAPRATRIFDDDYIPHKPPFIAYLTNLPFDANENDIYDFFGNIPLVSLRLPREDGETGRVRGFGYAEFETRDDLINVLSMPDPSIKGRRIRIDLSNEQEQQNNRSRGSRRGYEVFGSGNSEPRENTNWRRDAQENNNNNNNNNNNHSNGYGNNYDRGYNRDRRTRDDRDDNSGASAGSWRTGNRTFESQYDRVRVRTAERTEEVKMERPKLNLKPRTLPLPQIIAVPDPELPKHEEKAEADEEHEGEGEVVSVKPLPGVPAEKVFGSAKPVDTAAREAEIEQRLEEARRQEQQRREAEEKEVSQKLSEIQVKETEKENTTTTSWRRKADTADDNKNESGRKYSPDRRHDNRRIDNRERDYNRRNKNRDRNDRNDVQRLNKSQQNRDIKPRDDSKSKRDIKIERPLPKYQPQNQTGPVLQSSNKYSGLNDEASD